MSNKNKSRSEFIAKFQEKNKINIDNENIKKKGRWDLLYHQGKIMKMKEDKYREEMLELRNKEEFKECTFSPKKYTYYKTENIENPIKNYKNNNIKNFIKRQNKWLEKRALSIEGLKERTNNKDTEECYFEPIMVKNIFCKFQFDKISNKKVLKEHTSQILEDSESYNQYIKRLVKKREAIIKKQNLDKKIPGNGYLWNNKPKNYNLNYDYTKHLISNNLIYKIRNNNSDYIKKKSKSRTNFDCNFLKIQNLKKQHSNLDKIYNDLYINKSKKNNTEKIENNINEKKDLIVIPQKIQFGNALDILHNELYSFDINE